MLVALSLGSGRSGGIELSPAGEPVATTAAAADEAPEDEALAGGKPGQMGCARADGPLQSGCGAAPPPGMVSVGTSRGNVIGFRVNDPAR